ncbi:MAG TPA: YihY/virulence factor BrkB family protein [Candidatus Deferrimicrobiaceae bacterium]|nr:YihY/virulence factor BrkB family protein [Candidatus Deferrimicrobiaceae bacterium]
MLIDFRSALHRFNEASGFLLASALSFSFLLCLAPLALLFFSATGFLLASDQAAGSVIKVATSLLPGYSAEILGVLDLLNQERRVTGTLGVVGLAVFATPLFALTRTATNAAFRVQRGRGLVHGFAFDLGALAAVGVLAIALASALVLLATLSDIAASAGIPTSVLSSIWVRAVAPALLYVTLLGLLFFVYRTFPSTGVSTRAAMIATLIVATLWETARLAFATYLASFGTYGKLYGSFGVVAATFAWIYYSAALFVFGAGLTAVLTERRRGGAPAPAAAVAVETAAPAVPRSRLPAYLLSAVLGAVLVLFAAQNAAPVTLRLFAWALVDVPLAAVVLGALAAGALVAGLPLWIAHALLRSKVRAIESRPRPAEPGGLDR